MPLPFNKALDLKLLNLVKENQALYNPTHAKYLDVDCREVTWQKIGDALNRPAMEFAAIQCQIHFGDFHEEKHKPGLIENLNEYLPEEYSSSWGAEKKILKLYRNHQGLSPLDAKLVYIKTARDLPTFGVTFFIVKEQQKGKKKMVPRLLGINSESILRLDENTKEILQTWPLTHVKTYHAGKNDTFTLNFGDYSDKPYSVKTNDALRIRDILEGYIDIIRKRLCGPTSGHYAEGGAISQENVQSSRGNVMTHVVNTPSKVVEQSFVGPTRILPFEQGSQATQGTQVMTVQQVIVTNKGSTKQQVVSGEVPMRGDMSADLVKKLNRMNSNAVKLVTLLAEPTTKNIEEARNMLATMEKDLPIIQTGVTEAAGKQKSEEKRKKLLSELDELINILGSASHQLKSDKMDPEEVQDSARRIADLTTQMYFSLNPRRSELVRRSRQSFIADEKMEGTLRRASFIAAAAGASHAVDSAMDTIKEEYQGGRLSNQELEQLEAAAVDKLGKINAAVALFLTAHSDPNYIDYPAAVNSMNTIKELLPELATDAKAISHAKGGGVGQDITDEMKALCEATRRVCMLTGCDDHDKIQDAANGYADISGRLLYTVGGRCPRVSADKENEIVELSRQVGDCATLLLVQANELTEAAAAEPGVEKVDSAGVACADAARDLLACAQLTAPTIHEAHCQSALTAAAEGLSSSARRLALAWKPLVESPERHQTGENLTHHTMELAKALDKLKDAYANLGDMQVEEDHRMSPEQAQKLQFVTSVNSARGTLHAAQDELNKPLPPSTLSEGKINELHDNISQKMAQTNACVASLLQAKSDPQNPDYSTAELAVSTITELTPEVVRDARGLISTCKDERGRQAMLNDIRAWCRGVEGVCASSASDDPRELEDAATTFAQASRKMSFVFSPRARKAREQLMMELFSSAHEQAMQMVDDTNKMAASVGGASGDKLRGLSDAVGDSARALQNTLAVTASTMDSERCRSALQGRSEELASAASRLAREAEALQDDETGCRALASTVQAQRAQIQAHATALLDALAAIRSALDDPATHTVETQEESPAQRVQRLKFITSSSAVRDKAHEVEQILQQPVVSAKLDDQQAKQLEDKRARELAAVNAAVALLMHAKSDRENPDYNAADQAMETISEFMPRIVNDTRSLSGACADEAAREAMMRDIRAWCDAIQAVCASAENDDLTEFVDTAQQFADVSTKLNFVFNPRRGSAKEQLVVSQAGVACDAARQMASDAQDAARALPPAPAAQMRLRARNLAEGAQALQTTVQLAAPGLNSASSRAAVLATSEAVGAHAGELVSHAAHHSDLRCRDLGGQLAAQKEGLDKALHVIKDACSTGDAVESPAVKEQRAKFVTSLSSTQDNIDAAEKLLKEPTVGPKLLEPQAKDVQERLAREVARVNASVATLLQAKSDPDNPDYIVAEQSIDTISHLLPAIVKDMKALSTTCENQAQRQAMLHDLHSWCDNIRAVCASAGHDDDKELNEAAQKLASASNKMKFVVSHGSSPTKAHEVIQKAGSACDTAHRMAAEAERVSASLGGRAPAALAEQARRLHAAADKLRTTSQLTGPSIHEPASQTALAASATSLGLAAGTLVKEARHSSDPGLKILGVELQKEQDKMAATLKEVKDMCANRKMSTATLKAQQLKFVSSASAGEKIAKEAGQLIEEPTVGPKLSEHQAKDVQERLAQEVARVNASVATLLQAKSDPDNPDYIVAEQSIDNISHLLPAIVKDTKALSTACEDEAKRQAMLHDLHSWCDNIRAVCASAGHGDDKELNEAAQKLASASNKMKFVVSHRSSPTKAHEVIQKAGSACDTAHRMAAEAERVSSSLGGRAPAALAEQARRLHAAADKLRTTSQLTGPSIHEPASQTALAASATSLGLAAGTLVEEARHSSDPGLKILGVELQKEQDKMAATLKEVKDMCANRKMSTATLKAQQLKFVSSASAVEKRAKEAGQLIEEPTVGPKLSEPQAKDVQERLAQEVARVNASVATLLQAKSDPDNPDYIVAEQSIDNISHLLPAIVKDTKALSTACEDEAKRQAMLHDLHSWCDNIRAVCASAGHGDDKELNEAAQKLASASNKMKFVVSHRSSPTKAHEVIQKAGSACDTAHRMAAEAERVSSSLGGRAPAALAEQARRLHAAADKLRTTSQLTGPSIHEPASQTALVASAASLGLAAGTLVEEARHSSDPGLKILGVELQKEQDKMAATLKEVKDMCANRKMSTATLKAQQLKFVSSASAVEKRAKEAGQLIEEPTVGPKLSEHQAKDVQEKLAREVARVNASVATLLQAKSDPDNPDYIVAEQSIDNISHLLPAIVKDTKALSTACEDEAKRQAMLHDLHSWCDNIRAVCASAGHGDDKELSEAAQKLASASNKMKFVVSHRSSPTKAHEVIQKAGSACDTAHRMAAEAERVSSSLGGRAPAALAEQARRLHAAADKLRTTSQLTGPSIHEPASQTALAASATSLGLAAGTLVEEARHSSDPGLKILGVELQKEQDKMAATLKEVKDMCANRKMSTATLKAQQLKFVSSASAVEKRAKEAGQLIEEPVTGVKLSDQESKDVQEKLTKAMAQMNAALASLISAKSDPQHPDYRKAEQSIETISELIPKVINDAKDLSSTCKDDPARLAMTRDIRAWCDAIQAVCASAGHTDNKELNETALKLHQASQKLRFVVSARKNPVKEQQILQLSNSACDKARQMVEETRRAAREQAGPEAARLLARAQDVDDAADALHTTAQLTAACPEDGACQAALLSSSERLSSSAGALLQAAPRRLAEEAGRYRAVMERALAALRDTLTHGDTRGKRPPPPPVPVKRSSMSRDVPQSPRVRVVSHSDARRASQDWLDHMRRDASIDLESTTQPGGLSKKDIAELTKKAEEERLKKERFTKIVNEADKNVQEAERELEKLYHSNTGGPKLDEDQTESIQKQMEQKLAIAGDAAAKLVASSHPDVIDYTTATQCTETLSELVPDIVKDAALLSQARDGRSKRALLDHIKALCEATRRLVGTAKNDTQQLNEAAVEFGDKSAGLLYDVCSDVDPAQEKEVIVRARAAGDSAARLASRGAQLAAAAPALTRPLCDAGRLAADAARNLVYTAKLVAPWVHHQRCQNSLITASHELSSRMKEYSGTWKPLASDPQHGQAVAEMTKEAQDLENMLEGFRQELAAGKLVRRRQVEKIIVEDTGLRRLAAQVLEMAQMRAKSSVAPESSRQAYASYVRSLGAAIRGLDVANSRCRRQPHDLSKHQDLEGAVHTLQSTLLQARPCVDGRPQNNIIDLTEFVRDVSKEAEKLLTVANNTKGTQNKKEIETIKDECHKINVNAFRQLNPSDQDGEECSVDGITEVDQFAQDCDKRLESIKPNIEAIKEKEAKDVLREQSLQLVEGCHFLSFATKSALAMAQSAALDETLDDLHHLEKRVDKLLQPAEGAKTSGKPQPSSEAGLYQSKARVVSAAAGLGRGAAPALPPALAAYVTELRPHVDLVDSQQRNKVKDHVLRVLDTLKQLTATHVTRVATWQPAHDADIAALNDTLLQELDNPPTTAGDKPASKLLNESDINRLLMPADVTIEGDAKQVEEKLQQSASKLVMLSGTLLTAPPARAAPAAAAAALQMAAAARSLPHNRVQAKRTEEASQEMCMATYNLLKTAELAAGSPASSAARGMMGAAVRNLRDAISKLTRTASVGDKLVAACGDLSRSLQASALPAQAAGAPPYDHCVQLLATQRDVLQKLASDEPMSRAQFAQSLNYVTTAVCNSTESAAHCAYLISISEQHKDMAKEGLVDVPRLQRLTSGVQESCFRIMRSTEVELAKEEESKVSKLAEELNQALKEASNRAKDSSVKRELTEGGFKVDLAAKALHAAVHDANVPMDKISAHALSLVDSTGALNRVLERPSLTPVVGDVSPQTKALADHVMENSRKLISKTQTLIKEVKAADEDEDPMTWVTYNTARRSVLDAFDALLAGVKQSGERAGLVEVAKEEEEPEAPKKSFVEMQEDIARKWLQRRPSCGDVQAAGEQAAGTIIDIVHDMAEDISGQEKEDMENLVSESRTLLAECSQKYDNDNATALMELLRVARRLVQRSCVTRVVDDLLHDQPLQDLDIFIDAETDEAKRKFLLEKKIAELMSQLGRATRTARLVARAGGPAPQLEQCCQKTELLAPQLVKAAQARVATPDDKAVVEKYKALLAEYTQALSQVRETCDKAVDPLDFVQTAGETMARMREESSHHNDPKICAYTSSAITRLAGRVISVSMSAQCARSDPELRAALAEAQDKLAAAAPANVRASRLPHWQDTTAEILRTTGEVESALGGENIFKKLPEPDQPIYNAALSLHSAVRGWSARDNEMVAVAKRMAVLMARLSHQMTTDRKRELIATSKSIVTESREVTALAKKLAQECTDVRIRTNLLQVCERIPTISGQLKMLTVVKGSSLGNQGGEEDREAMNMLVTNAQNLMSSVQEVVKAAASASVKIASQRGLKWVRKNY